MSKVWVLVEGIQMGGSEGRPDNSLPGMQPGGGRPEQSLPWGPGRPNQGLPGPQPGVGNQLPNQPNYPSQGLPPPQASQLPPPDADVKPVPQSYVPLYNTQHGWYYVPVDALKDDSGGGSGNRPDNTLPGGPPPHVGNVVPGQPVAGQPLPGGPPGHVSGQPTPPQPGIGGQLPPGHVSGQPVPPTATPTRR